jgi:hypothetical protein
MSRFAPGRATLASWLRLRPGADAQTDARQVAARVTGLPGDDPFVALTTVAAAIKPLRAGKPMKIAVTQDALELLDHVARAHYRDATRRYLRERNRLTEPQLATLSCQVEDCLVQLAQCYQSHVVLWRTQAAGNGAAKGMFVRAMAGGTRACASLLKWSYLRQTECRVGVWADICTLYATAETAACERVPVRLAPGAVQTSVEREFLKGCMLAAAHPQALLPGQVDIAERLLEYCAADIGLEKVNAHGLPFFIDLAAGEPPQVGAASAALPPYSRWFGVHSADRFRRLQRLIATDRLAPSLLSVDVDKSAVMQVLEHLAARWLLGATENKEICRAA